MSDPVYFKDYAPAAVTARYGYFASVLKPGMTDEQIRRALSSFSDSHLGNDQVFTPLSPEEIEAFISNYTIVASTGDPAFNRSSGLDAVILRSKTNAELTVSIGGVGPTNNIGLAEIGVTYAVTDLYGFEIFEFRDLQRLFSGIGPEYNGDIINIYGHSKGAQLASVFYADLIRSGQSGRVNGVFEFSGLGVNTDPLHFPIISDAIDSALYGSNFDPAIAAEARQLLKILEDGQVSGANNKIVGFTADADQVVGGLSPAAGWTRYGLQYSVPSTEPIFGGKNTFLGINKDRLFYAHALLELERFMRASANNQTPLPDTRPMLIGRPLEDQAGDIVVVGRRIRQTGGASAGVRQRDPITGIYLPRGLTLKDARSKQAQDQSGRTVEYHIAGDPGDEYIDKSFTYDSINSETGKADIIVVVEYDRQGRKISSDIRVANNPIGVEFSDAGRLLGQLLGVRLAGDNQLVGAVLSASLETVGDNLGDLFDGLLGGQSTTEAAKDATQAFGAEFLSNLKSAGVGALSSFLTAELIHVIGLSGFAGELANTSAGYAIGAILQNIADHKAVFEGLSLTQLGNVAGAFIGTKLASIVWQPDTIGGQIGAAFGSALGTIAATSSALGLTNALAFLGGAAGPVGAAIGAFIGFFVGGLIGSIFGGTPRSGADVAWDPAKQQFVVTNIWSRKGGSKEAAVGIASSVSTTINAVLSAAGGELLDPTAVQSGSYGMVKKEFVYRPTGGGSDQGEITKKFKGKEAATNLVGYGLYQAFTDHDFQIAGGDFYIKRAFYNSFALGDINPDKFDVSIIIGNISSAQSYERYISNAAAIGALTSAEPDSVFAAEVALTIAQASDLGLTRRAASDWFGGFVHLLKDTETNAGATSFNFAFDRSSGQIGRRIEAGSYSLDDTIDIGGQTTILGSADGENIDLRTANLANQIGYIVNGHLNNDIAVSGADFTDTSTTLAFAAGERRKAVAVAVANDGIAEVAESFLGQLSNAPGMRIMGGDATATIVDGANALATLIVGNSYAWEGDGYAVFRLSLSKAASSAVSVDLALADGRASGNGVDYGAAGTPGLEVSVDGVNWSAASSATFAAGQTELFVRTAVIADNGVDAQGKPTNVEGNETFKLSATVTAGATALANSATTVTGTGTIVDGAGDEPLVWIDDVVVDEASGQAVFTVSRSRTTAAPATVDFATADRRQLHIDIAATVDAGDGNDIVYASDLGDNVFGGAGNDTLYGGRLDDWLLGGDGDDTLNAGSIGAGTLGGDGNYLNGGAGNDVLIGREGSDWLEGGDGTDILEGGDGDDILAGGAGVHDVLHGGRGNDHYIFRLGDVGSLNPADADEIRDESGLSLNSVVEQAYAGSTTYDAAAADGSLFLNGRGLNNWRGGGAQATAQGIAAGGDDRVVFGPGITIEDIKLMKSTDGADIIIELWPNGVFAGDRLVLKDWFNAFNKIETLQFADGNELRLADFDTFILGSSAADTIIGTAGNDFVHAGAGNDVVYLLSGNDFGNGGLGDDTVSGDSGNDIVVGADGNDTLFGGYGQDTVSGGRGNDFVSGDDGNDILAGGEGDDLLIGGSGNDVFKYSRGDGRDTLIDALTNEWDVVWISGKGGQNGYVVNPDGTITHPDYGVLFDGQHWNAFTRYDIETGTLYRHRPANADAIVANSGSDILEFGIGIDINDVQIQSANGGKDLVLGIGAAGGDESFASLTDQIILKEWGPNGNAAARGSIEKFAFFNTGVIDTAATALAGGTDGDDALAGTGGTANWITGGAGNDTITGADLNDILNGNGGQDTLIGGADADVLIGGADNDVLIGGANGMRDGAAAGDILIGGEGLDIASYENATAGVTASLSDNSGNTGDAAGDSYDGIEGLRGSTFDDTLIGDDGDNELRGDKGDDKLRGGLGDDTYIFGRGDGSDKISDQYIASEDVIVDASGKLQPPYISRVELNDYVGGMYAYDHVVENSETGDVIYRKTLAPTNNPALTPPTTFDATGWMDAGQLTFTGSKVAAAQSMGSGGNDTLLFEDYTGNPGVSGDATIALSDLSFAFDVAGGLPNDLVITLNGGAGDQVRIQNFRNGAAIDADRAIETIQFSDGTSVNLAGLRFDAAGNLLSASADTEAAPVDDFIVSDLLATSGTISGGFGDDTLLGGAGANRFDGGAGNDLIVGGLGADTIYGGAGNDTVSYIGSDGIAGVTVNLATDVIGSSGASGAGSEAVGDTFDSIENVVGSQFADTITGNDADNVLKGNRGDDLLSGGAGSGVTYGIGADVLLGDDGNDTLNGGVGDDNLDGGTGNDLLDGGGDRDTLAGGDGNDILRGDGVDGAAVGGNLLINAGFEDAGAATDDVAVAGLGLSSTDLPGWTSSAARPFELATTASGLTPAQGARAITLDDGQGNIQISQTIGKLAQGEVLALSYNYASQVSGASGGFEVLWNGVVVASGNGTNAFAASTVINLTAIEGDNVLSFRGTGTVDGLGAIIDNVQLNRTTGAADQLIGGAGSDRLEGGAGNDTLLGGDGDDSSAISITAGVGAGVTATAGLYGGDGDDILDGGAGNDTLDGGAGNDKYLFAPGSGDDVVTIGGGNDQLLFDKIKADQLWLSKGGASQTDLVITAIGLGTSVTVKNWFLAGSTTDEARCLVTTDKVLAKSDVAALVAAFAAESATVPTSWPATPSSALTDAINAAWQANDQYSDHVVYTGTTGNDTLTFDPGLTGGAKFYSLGGNDSLTGGAGDDEFHVGVDGGYDTVSGGAGNDVIIADVDNATIGLAAITGVERISAGGKAGVAINLAPAASISFASVALDGITRINGSSGNDVIVGSSGDDRIKGGGGNDTLDGGDGNDTYDASDVNVTGTIDLSNPGGQSHITGTTVDLLANFENVVAGNAVDTIIGSSVANRIDAGGGNDFVDGGAGDDVLIGGAGADKLVGGAGIDTASYETMATAFAAPTVDAASGISIDGVKVDLKVNSSSDGNAAPATKASQGDAAGDWFYQIENLTGSNFNDLLHGDDGANVLRGGDGNDALFGGLGDDTLSGDAGNDYLDGEAGMNTVVYAGNRADYDIVTGAVTTVTGLGDRAIDGVDRLKNINFIQFADVRVNLGIDPNNKPILGVPAMADQTINDGVAYTYQIPATAFIDLDLGDTMTFAATLADGSALPSWLAFDAATRTFSGTPPVGVIGTTIEVLVTATDPAGTGASWTISDSFLLTVNAARGADITGTAGRDTISGTFRSESVSGLAGDDVILGSGGADAIDGGAGSDRVDYSASSAAVTVDLAAGTGSGGDAEGDTLAAIEQVYGSAFDDVLTGTDGDDVLFGQAGNDTLRGGGGNDLLDGGDGTNVLAGGAGNDAIYARTGSDGKLLDAVDGGDGVDTLYLVESAFAAIIDLVGQGTNPVSIEHVVGSNFADTITGNGFANNLSGGGGDDALDGGDGADTLSGGDGNDRLTGGRGDDILRGDAGDDTLTGGAGADTIDGGAGVDTVDYSTSGAAVTVNLQTNTVSGGDAEGDTLAVGTIENVTGSAYADGLTGNAGANEIHGLDGNDVIAGLDGDDTLYGDAGDDTVSGGSGNDTVYGGSGNDVIAGDDGADLLYGEDGNDTLRGGAGNDTLYGGSGDDILDGEGGNDIIHGDDGNDTIQALVVGEDTIDGGAGVDTVSFALATTDLAIDLNNPAHKLTSIENITGGTGSDTITGSADANRIDGGAGNDIIQGGAGADVLIGGAGTDTLSYAASGLGTSFSSGLIGQSTVNSVVVVAAVNRTLDGVDVDLVANTASGADATGDVISGFENLQGSAYADRLRGTAGNSVVHGGAGDDVVYGGAGDDWLYGDDGNDIIFGEAGVDHIFGGDGDDRLFGDGASDYLFGDAGNDLLDAGDAGDQLDGGTGNDILIGGLGQDSYIIRRNSGADTIYNYDDDSAVDSVSYDSADAIQYSELWFSKSGRDLMVKILGTSTVTTIKDWFVNATAGDWAAADNFYVDIFIAGNRINRQVNLAGLLDATQGIAEPTSYSALSNSVRGLIDAAWGLNSKPTVTGLASNPTSVNEDGSINLRFTVGDAETAPASLSIAVVTNGVLQTVADSDIRVVDAVTREVTIRPTANANGSGNVRVRAYDGALYSDELVVPLTVAAVADGVTLGAPASVTGNANTAISLAGIVATLFDNDGSEILDTLQIEGIPSGATITDGVRTSTIGAATVDIRGWTLANLQINPGASSVDFSLTVRARSREQSNGNVSLDVTRSIAVSVNGAPAGLSLAYSAPLFSENSTGVLVGTLTAVDPGDSGGSYVYAVTGAEANRFTISGNQLFLKPGVALDYEAGDVTVGIQVTDNTTGTPLSYSGSVVVRPADVNEAPVNIRDADAAANVVTEGVAGGTGVTIAATDPEGRPLTYSITSGNSNGWFAINASTGVVTVNSSLDYEATVGGQVTLNVAATDDIGQQVALNTVTIAVNDVNEAPYFTSANSASVSEAVAGPVYVATITTGDPDRDGVAFGEAGHVISIASASNEFQILNGNQLWTKPGVVLDYDNPNTRSYSLTLRVYDNSGNPGWLDAYQNFTVNVAPVDELPTTPNAFGGNVNENYTGYLLTVGGSVDPEGVPVTYNFAAGGNPGGLFSIDANGNLSLNTAIDYENRVAAFAPGYADVSVVAVTPTGNSAVRTGRITLLNVNEAPTTPGANIGAVSFNENTTGDTGIRYYASDPDGDAVQYLFGNGSTVQGNFQLVGNALYVISAFDYESTQVAGTQVYAYANGQYSPTTVSNTLYINNLDDNVPVAQGVYFQNGFSSNIVENSITPGSNAVLAHVYAGDADGDALSYSIVGGNGSGVFSVDGNGDIRVPGGIDYEALGGARNIGADAPLAITLTIRAYQNNNQGRYVDQNLNLTIIDLAESTPIYNGAADLTYHYGNNAPPNLYPANDTLYTTGFTSGFGAIAHIAGSQAGVGTWNSIVRSTDTSFAAAFADNGTWLSRETWVSNNPVYQVSTKVGYRWEGAPFASRFLQDLPPIVLDLDNSGIRQSPVSVQFDVDGDGIKDDTGWISRGQGLLALDRNGNGVIDNGTEISFANDLPGASTDLEGLAAYDSNGDGVLDVRDARFGDFVVWQDRNENGVSEAGELCSLSDAGIVSIALHGTPAAPSDEGGQAILALSTFTRADGTSAAVGDVALRWTSGSAADPVASPPAYKQPSRNEAKVVDAAEEPLSVGDDVPGAGQIGNISPILMPLTFAAEGEDTDAGEVGIGDGLDYPSRSMLPFRAAQRVALPHHQSRDTSPDTIQSLDNRSVHHVQNDLSDGLNPDFTGYPWLNSVKGPSIVPAIDTLAGSLVAATARFGVSGEVSDLLVPKPQEMIYANFHAGS